MNDKSTRRGFLFGPALILSLSFLPSLVLAADIRTKYWDEWDCAAKIRCPSHHLELLGDVYDELIDDFVQTLPQKVQRKVNSIADYSRRCADETAGFYCDMAVNVDAFKRLGLLEKFTAFSCRQYKCIEGACCVDPRTNKFR